MIPCMGLLTGNPIDGHEYTCDYEHGEILCDDCVCNLGDLTLVLEKEQVGNCGEK